MRVFTKEVGVFSPRKLARFYHGSWHADINESKKNKNILKKVLTNVLTYVIIYSNSGILLKITQRNNLAKKKT